ncbi:MAG: PBP1A family penicillin-binding protein [Syntrophobacterales bacterium]|nr:PBP1A family penicillin-binding protein [Syntrophobacterales bacterium]
MKRKEDSTNSRLYNHFSKKGSLSLWITVSLVIILSLLAFAIGVGLSLYNNITKGLPSVDSLKNYHPPLVTTFYAADETPIAEFYHERRYLVRINDIPRHVIKAFLAAEDARFYEHPGIDIWGVLRAALANLRAGTIVQGGSTITQQVVKSLLLSPERTWQRKIREAILAYKIDKFLSKDEILELYLNQVYFGAGAYGVEAAARTFFGKHVQDLNIAEAALIAGLPKAPSKFNPYENFDEARRRQLFVIQRMEEERFISKKEAEEARQQLIELKGHRGKSLKEMNHFIEEVRRRLVDRYGEKIFYEEGLQVYTTYDIKAQSLAERALLKGLSDYEKRHGFKGVLKVIPKTQWKAFIQELRERQQNILEDQILDGLVLASDDSRKAFVVSVGSKEFLLERSGWEWTGKGYSTMKSLLQPGSVIKVSVRKMPLKPVPSKRTREEPKIVEALILEQSLEVEGAMIVADLKTGDVLALVGGRDFRSSQFNRATQAKRQPGSAFKPIVYAAAVDQGFTELTTVVDAPIVFKGSNGKLWKPGNYDGSYMGPMTLRKALALSRNVVAVKLANAVGIEEVVDMARKLGIESPLTPTLALSLGASGLPLIELTQAYSVFANNGVLVPFRFVTKVLDRHGNILEEFPVFQKTAISPDTAYIITDMLTAVIQEGTGKAAKALGRPVAGKTGTSNEFRDAWFIGYTPDYIAGVWVGYDDNTRSLGHGEAGGKLACPIWTDFMKEWLVDKPAKPFTPPPQVVFVKVASVDGSEKTAYVPFKPDTVSSRKAYLEPPSEEESAIVEDRSIPEEEGGESVYKSGLF